MLWQGSLGMGRVTTPRSWLSTTVHRVPRYPKTLTLSTPPWMVQGLCSIPHAERDGCWRFARAAASVAREGAVQEDSQADLAESPLVEFAVVVAAD